MARIYKILTRAEWDQALAQGVFEGSAVDRADGFIHFSTAAQAAETARRHFAGQAGLVVLEIEAGRGRFFAGSWHNWRKEQAAREIALGKAIAKQEAQIARMEDFVRRFSAKATKASVAVSGCG